MSESPIRSSGSFLEALARETGSSQAAQKQALPDLMAEPPQPTEPDRQAEPPPPAAEPASAASSEILQALPATGSKHITQLRDELSLEAVALGTALMQVQNAGLVELSDDGEASLTRLGQLLRDSPA